MAKHLGCVLALLAVFGHLTAVPVKADIASCAFLPSGGFTTNRQENGTSGSVYGVKAVINPTLATFRPCTLSLQDPDLGEYPDGTSAWIAVVPTTDNPEGGSPTAILQVGINHCNNKLEYPGLCDPGQLTAFWAYGGCSGIYPVGHYLYDLDDNQHTYEIRHVSSGGSRYSLYIDGTYTSITKYVSDTGLSCWLGDRHQAQYSAETWNAGDGIANTSAKLIFSAVGWRITDSGAWQDPTWSGTDPCDEVVSTTYLNLNCDISNADPTQFYSWTTIK